MPTTSWRLKSFGPASEEPYRRRFTDWARLVVATAALVGLSFRVGHPSAVEVDVFRLVNGLPSQLSSTFRGMSAAGTLWAVALAVAAAVVSRRWRLARDLLLAGVAAWAVSHIMAAFVAGDGFSRSLRAVTHVRGTHPQFPLSRVAVVVAVVATAAPYLTRPTRRVGAGFALLTAVSAMYFGAGLPNDVLGGLFLGLAIAAGVHLVFGSPGGRPTSAQVTAALAELGIGADELHLAPRQPVGATLMLGRDREGPIEVRVLGRDEADAELAQKLWRSVAFRGPGQPLFLTRLQEVEHSAYVTIVARDHGARTPKVVAAGEAGPKAALLVERPVAGRRLADMGPEEVSDAALVDLWRQVAALRAARIRHGGLDTARVVVNDGCAAVTGFGPASGLSATDLDRDVVSLLVSTAALVGTQRAVTALARGAGAETLPPVLPLLQPAALSQTLRSTVGRRNLKQSLEELRAAGAEAAGVETPPLQQLHRVSGTNLALAVATLLGLAALLGQVSHPEKLWQAVHHADWAWIGVAFALSMGTNIPYAVALMGAVPRRLPLWPTTELQVSMSFTNLAVPAVGGVAAQVRFLQKQGVDLVSAVAAGGLLSTVANGAVNLAMFAVALALSPHAFHFALVPLNGALPVVLGLVGALGVAAAIVLGVPRLRAAVVPPLRQATTTVVSVLLSRRQVSLLVLGFTSANVAFMFCLSASLRAFGASVSLWTLLALVVGMQTISSLVPVPGGGTAVSAVGMSGVITGFGVPTNVAVAAVLTHQLVVTYLPAVPGWFATRHLIKKDEL